MNFYKGRMVVMSTRKDQSKYFEVNEAIIHRFISLTGNRPLRLIKYLYFFTRALFVLIKIRPEKVVYYETMSALPALIYRRMFSRYVQLFAHYHEYTSPDEYKKGMAVVKFAHWMEIKYYPKMAWISHTNEQRKALFCGDNMLPPEAVGVMPNYPSEKWGIPNQTWKDSEPLQLVFVGYSVDQESSYILELIAWLSSQTHPTQLDLYCLKTDAFTLSLQGKHGTLTVTVLPPIDYFSLPKILCKYHIGLILYKAQTFNYIYNAPNKLFEYLACGLDVWYPLGMKTMQEYNSLKSSKVVELDFDHLSALNILELAAPYPLKYEKHSFKFTAEIALDPLQKMLIES